MTHAAAWIAAVVAGCGFEVAFGVCVGKFIKRARGPEVRPFTRAEMHETLRREDKYAKAKGARR